jgi:hypothetical protein
MTPLDFLTYAFENDENDRDNVKKALSKELVILSEDGEYEILSYYLGRDGRMVIDIQPT